MDINGNTLKVGDDVYYPYDGVLVQGTIRSIYCDGRVHVRGFITDSPHLTMVKVNVMTHKLDMGGDNPITSFDGVTLTRDRCVVGVVVKLSESSEYYSTTHSDFNPSDGTLGVVMGVNFGYGLPVGVLWDNLSYNSYELCDLLIM